MKKKIKYKDETERSAILEGNAGMRLIEDARHGGGNHLIFTDETELVPAITMAERVAALETRLVALEKQP